MHSLEIDGWRLGSTLWPSEKNYIAGSHRSAVAYTFCAADGKSSHFII